MTIQDCLKSQYHAALTMLLDAMDACPPALWTDASYVNPFWHVAYHTLFYTDFYLEPSETTFVPWPHHRQGHNRFASHPDAAASVVPYTAAELRAYLAHVQQKVDTAVDRLDLTAPESGFPWYRMSKLEHQIVNVRHLAHHVGQLAERVRQTSNHGVRWVRGEREIERSA